MQAAWEADEIISTPVKPWEADEVVGKPWEQDDIVAEANPLTSAAAESRSAADMEVASQFSTEPPQPLIPDAAAPVAEAQTRFSDPTREEIASNDTLNAFESADTPLKAVAAALQTGPRIIPRSEGEGVAAGLQNAAGNLVSSIVSPLGVGTVGLAAAPVAIQKAAAAGFTGLMAKSVPDQIEAISNAETAAEKVEATTGLVATLGFGALGGKFAAGRQGRVPMAVAAEQTLSKLADEKPPTPIEPDSLQTSSPENQTGSAPTRPSTGEPIAPGAEGVSSAQGNAVVAPAKPTPYSIAPEVQKLLSEEPVAAESGTGLRRLSSGPSSQGGGIFTSGGTKATAVGATPKGFKNWLKIPEGYKRLLSGLERKGVRAVLEDTNNPVGKTLGKQTRAHVDLEQELLGQSAAHIERAHAGLKRSEIQKAYDEASLFIREKENGRPTPSISPAARKVLDAWETIADESGNVMQANNVQVFDRATGGYRPARKLGKDYIPRMFSREVERVLSNPESDPVMFNNLAQAIATHRGVSIEAAAAELNQTASRFSSNDFMGNLEMARGEQLPEIFYEYDLRNIASRYIPSYAERMAQIIAFGQRLGTRENPIKKNLWDVARDESRDTHTKEWLNAAEDAATNVQPKRPAARIMRRLQTLASGSLLSDPTTTVPRNVISGLIAPTELFGVARSLKGVVDVVKNSQTRMMAREVGAVRENLGQYLHADQLGNSFWDDATSFFTDKALKLSGNTASETFVRSHSGAVASQFVKDAAASLQKNPSSGFSKEALGMFKRWGIDGEKILAEGGDWKTGLESRKFIRTAIREMQGGYRYDQVPLWAQSPTGRFFYQYGRWGAQRAQHLFENVIKPLIGEEVEWHGKKMVNRKVAPLVRTGAALVVAGESFAALSKGLFGRDRRDSSISEIKQAWDEDELKALKLAGMRLINDITMGGQLGIWSQPADFLMTIKDQSRLKNPLEPPSFASTKALAELAQSAMDQGEVTKRDLMRFAGSVVRGARNVYNVARNIMDEPLYEAQKDAGNLRGAIKRWEKLKGKDLSPRAASRKSANSPAYEAIEDALLTGDAEKAKALRKEFVSNWKNNESESSAAALRKLKSAIRGRQPFRAADNDSQNKREFFKWAEKNLSKDDYNAIKRVQDRYLQAAKSAGLN